MFTLKNPTNKIKERHLIFVYLQKAYDTVPLSKLWSCMQASGISKAYVNAVKVLYNNITSTVKIGRTLSQKFPVTRSLRQGCSLSLLLFKIYLEGALSLGRRSVAAWVCQSGMKRYTHCYLPTTRY